MSSTSLGLRSLKAALFNNSRPQIFGQSLLTKQSGLNHRRFSSLFSRSTISDVFSRQKSLGQAKTFTPPSTNRYYHPNTGHFTPNAGHYPPPVRGYQPNTTYYQQGFTFSPSVRSSSPTPSTSSGTTVVPQARRATARPLASSTTPAKPAELLSVIRGEQRPDSGIVPVRRFAYKDPITGEHVSEAWKGIHEMDQFIYRTGDGKLLKSFEPLQQNVAPVSSSVKVFSAKDSAKSSPTLSASSGTTVVPQVRRTTARPLASSTTPAKPAELLSVIRGEQRHDPGIVPVRRYAYTDPVTGKRVSDDWKGIHEMDQFIYRTGDGKLLKSFEPLQQNVAPASSSVKVFSTKDSAKVDAYINSLS